MQRIKAKFPRGFIPVLQRNFLLKNWRILKVPHQFNLERNFSGILGSPLDQKAMLEEVLRCKEEGGRLYRLKDYHAAIQAFSQSIVLVKENPRVYNDLHILYSNRCACYLQLNILDAALMDAEACVASKSDYSKGYSRLGEVNSKLNRYNDAFIAYQKAVNLDATNTDAYKELNKIKQKLSQGGSSTSNSSSTGNSSSNQTRSETNTSRQSASNDAGTRNTPQNSNNGNVDVMNTLRSAGAAIWNYIARMLIQIYDFFESMSPSSRQYFFAFIAIMFFYYVFIYRTRSSGYYDDNYYSNYNNYNYNRGFSWTTTLMIMGAAYYIPPQLPELFGQHARPFFGMNWTTFLWLLNMFGNNRGGFNYGTYGRRRRYF